MPGGWEDAFALIAGTFGGITAESLWAMDFEDLAWWCERAWWLIEKRHGR